MFVPTGGFKAAGRRIWVTVVFNYVVGVTKRFLAEEPANDFEATVFKTIRDLVIIMKGRLKRSEPTTARPDS